jgi:hypothetical protein
MTAPARNLQESNQAGLCRELDRVYASLTGKTAPIDPGVDAPRALRLEHLCETFRLTPFERDLLLLCAGCELESRFGEACAVAHQR